MEYINKPSPLIDVSKVKSKDMRFINFLFVKIILSLTLFSCSEEDGVNGSGGNQICVD